MAISNDLNIGEEGVVYFNGTNTFTGLDGGTAGRVLTSNGTNVAPSFQAAAGITTLTGDTGSATGSNITLYANNAVNNSGQTVLFTNSGSTSTLNVTDSIKNTCIGLSSGKSGMSGVDSTTLGYESGSGLTTGGLNTAIGSGALKTCSTGNSNTAVGVNALKLYNAIGNTAVGFHALELSTVRYNTAVGNSCLAAVTTGTQNSALGLSAGSGVTSGNANTAMGYSTLTGACGSSNTAIGNAALGLNAGSNNTAVGDSALVNYTGSANTAVGYLACRDTTGVGNTSVGYIALVNNSSGTNNTAVGYQALTNKVTGSNCTALGYNAGSSYTTSDANNICIGANVTGTVGESNVTRIGSGQTTAYMQGISGVSVANTNTVTINSSTGQLGSVVGNPTVVIKSADIDFKTVGNTTIFTPTANFVVTGITPYAKTLAGVIGAPVINIGTIAANYDNYVSGLTLSVTQGNAISSAYGNDSVIVTSGTALVVRVSVADATATTNTQVIYITGFYL